MGNVFTIASREFSDTVRSKRFIILIVIFGLVMIIPMITIYVQVMRMMPDMPGVPMPTAFLGMMGYMLSSTLSTFAPVMGVALGCDTISGEREKGTLKIILAQPVFRDTVINGKFLAATSAVSLAVLITSLATIGTSTIAMGVTPTAEEALRIALFLPFAVLFTMTYYGISAFLSTILKKTSQSVILSVTMWAVFTFVIPVIASFVAIMIAPLRFEPGQQGVENGIGGYLAVIETISSITPNYHFGKIGQYLLGLYATAPAQGEASITSSLMHAGPNVLVLVIVTALVFIASYIAFTRQEVR
jgi:ABC-2 type transport system permease protein